MSPSPAEVRRARTVTRTVAFLLFAGGAFQVWIAAQGTGPPVRYLPGFLGVAAGAGLWLRTRWARWLALGACYLALVCACVGPILSFLLRHYDGPAEAFASNISSILLAIVVGAIGYSGLSFLRSDEGRREFSGGGDAEDPLPYESSAAVILSSLVWIVALGVMSFGGISNDTAPAAQPSALDRPENIPEPPDLVPLGLCMERGRWMEVKLVYANIGKGATGLKFRLTSADDMVHARQKFERDLDVPAPGETLTIPFERAYEETREGMVVWLDEENRVPDADYENNLARFELPRDGNGILVLPSCDAVQFLPPGAQDRAARQGPPNLVPLGLCVGANAQIDLRITNLGGPTRRVRGGPLSTVFEITHAFGGNGPGSSGYKPVPNYREILSINLIMIGFSDRGPLTGSLDVVVKLDASDAIRESNETDNVLSSRITWRRPDKINLPACARFDPYFYDTFVPADVPPAPPPAEKLPDLIPLGLCAGNVVIGNIGTAKGTAGVSITAQMKGKPTLVMQGSLEFTPWPGAVGKIPITMDLRDVPGQLVVDVDPRNSIFELDETNNSASFAIGRREDGGLDLPDCTLVDVRVDKWNAPKNSPKGTK